MIAGIGVVILIAVLIIAEATGGINLHYAEEPILEDQVDIA